MHMTTEREAKDTRGECRCGHGTSTGVCEYNPSPDQRKCSLSLSLSLSVSQALCLTHSQLDPQVTHERQSNPSELGSREYSRPTADPDIFNQLKPNSLWFGFQNTRFVYLGEKHLLIIVHLHACLSWQSRPTTTRTDIPSCGDCSLSISSVKPPAPPFQKSGSSSSNQEHGCTVIVHTTTGR